MMLLALFAFIFQVFGASTDSSAQLADSLFNNPVTEIDSTNDIAVVDEVAQFVAPTRRRGKRDKLPLSAASQNQARPPGESVGPVQRSLLDTLGLTDASAASQIHQGSHDPSRRQRVAGETEAQYVLPQKRTKDDSGEPTSCEQPASKPRITRARYPTPAELYRRIPAKCNKHYGCEATLGQVLVVLVAEAWLEPAAFADDMQGVAEDRRCIDARVAMSRVSPEYEAIIDNVPKLLMVDFSSLLDEDLEYASRVDIEKPMVWKMTACLVYYKMDYGLVVRYLSGEYTGEWRNVEAVLAAVAPFVDKEDLVHIARVLDEKEASPVEFTMYETDENKEAFIRRGNGRSVTENMDAVYKVLVKEVRNHHLMTFMRWTVRASPYAHHVPQEYIPPKNEGAKGRFIWNGTIKWLASLITMNEATSTENEAPITFGYVYIAFLTWIYNLRIQFPFEDILLAYIDISSCFRYPRIFADLVGAFGFIVGPWYFAANAMVFGSVASASSWEPLRRAIAAVAAACFARTWLIAKHQQYLDMAGWEPVPADDVTFVQALRCTQNQGILDEHGNERPTPHYIYGDDDLIADIRRRMPQALVSAIEAIFTVIGVPCERLRACAIALDKWRQLFVSYCVVLLGLRINTRSMTVGVTDEYRTGVLELLDTTWHTGRDAFYVGEMEKLIGKLGRIGQAYRPIYHLMPHMYASVAYALRENEFFLAANSRKFRAMLKQLKMKATNEDDMREINFAKSTMAKMKHRTKIKYRMPPSLKEEIRIIRALLKDDSIRLETPIAHIVPRDCNYFSATETCKSACGGWSIGLSFWWHYDWPEDIQRRARLSNNQSGQKIPIEVLRMAGIILNFAAAIVACHKDGTSLDAFPMLANDCNGTSACNWVNFNCKTNMMGRALGRIYVGMLMSTKLGIQASLVSSVENEIAAEVSQSQGKDGVYEYSRIHTNYPALSCCRLFQPSDTLLGMILGVLRTSVSQCPLTVAKLKPTALGSITSLDM